MSLVKVATATLQGAALDWAIATLQGHPIEQDPMGFKDGPQAGFWIWRDSANANPTYQLIGHDYAPSRDWAQAGPVMQQYHIYPSLYGGCGANNPDKFHAGTGLAWCRGDTPLVAALRAIVSSQMGQETKVPSPLLPCPA